MRVLPKSGDGKADEFASRLDLLCISAENELTAFFAAVNTLFGADKARKAAFLWLEELESIDWSKQESMPDWRQTTVAASARLSSSRQH